MKHHIFFYLGKRYEMTEEELEAAYRFRQQQYLEKDAKSHLDEFIFGGDPGNMSEFDIEYQVADFFERYHMEVEEAYGKLQDIVSRFEKCADCNIDENSRWDNAIRDVLTGN